MSASLLLKPCGGSFDVMEGGGLQGTPMQQIFVEQAVCRVIGELRGALMLLEGSGEDCFGFEEEIQEAIRHLESCLHGKH
jgi:hypothetical protein